MRSIVSKSELVAAIRPVLRIWLKTTDKPKRHLLKVKPRATLPYTIEKEKATCKMWLAELRKRCTEEEMKELYKQQHEMLKRENLWTYEDWIKQ